MMELGLIILSAVCLVLLIICVALGVSLHDEEKRNEKTQSMLVSKLATANQDKQELERRLSIAKANNQDLGGKLSATRADFGEASKYKNRFARQVESLQAEQRSNLREIARLKQLVSNLQEGLTKVNEIYQEKENGFLTFVETLMMETKTCLKILKGEDEEDEGDHCGQQNDQEVKSFE